MPYTSSPFAAKARKLAVTTLKREGLSQADMARRMGVHRSTIGRWLKRDTPHHRQGIETRSSRPYHHPKALPESTINRIVELRLKLGRCAPIIHTQLLREGVKVSLPSVQRTLKRKNLVRKKKQAKYHDKIQRPPVLAPGELVQVDTIHFVRADYSRFYVYAVIDLYSRLAWACYSPSINQRVSLRVVKAAEKKLGFKFKLIQTDNGPEFRDFFKIELTRNFTRLRHSRVRRPNDNAHVERFIRTLQDECLLNTGFPKEKGLQRKLDQYLDYYNNERLHLSLDCLTPSQFVAKVLS